MSKFWKDMMGTGSVYAEKELEKEGILEACDGILDDAFEKFIYINKQIDSELLIFKMEELVPYMNAGITDAEELFQRTVPKRINGMERLVESNGFWGNIGKGMEKKEKDEVAECVRLIQLWDHSLEKQWVEDEIRELRGLPKDESWTAYNRGAGMQEKSAGQDKEYQGKQEIEDARKLLDYLEKQMQGSLSEDDKLAMRTHAAEWKKSIQTLQRYVSE